MAETHSVQSQDAEGVVDVGRQFEVSGRLGSRHLGEVVPVATMVQRVLKLDQKFCRKRKKREVYSICSHVHVKNIGFFFRVSFAATLSSHTHSTNTH